MENRQPMTQRGVFLDRDGVLVRSQIRNGKAYAPRRLEDFMIYPQASAALQHLKQRGFVLIVVTNQPDVGNGLVPKEIVDEMNAQLFRDLPVDGLKVCFHAQTDGCDCRKPKPGMLLDAAAEFGIDLQDSYMVGDRWSDTAAGRAAGCTTVFIDRAYAETNRESADATVSDITEAAEWILAKHTDITGESRETDVTRA